MNCSLFCTKKKEQFIEYKPYNITFMKGIVILKDLKDLQIFWPVQAFEKAYPEEGYIRKCAAITLYDENKPDHAAMVMVRIFIENGERAKSDQKYVVGIRSYSFGDMMTIDVISLDKGYHKEICYDHLKRLNWPMWNELTSRPVDMIGESTLSPFLFIGGHLKVEEGEKVNFFGSSGDYGDKILFSDGNSIAAYAASLSGIELGLGDKEIGENFVMEMLDLTYDQKKTPDFYEKLIAHVFNMSQDVNITLTAQHVGALVTMKVADRFINENKDFITLIVEETCGGGIGRAITLNSIARKLRMKYQDKDTYN
jgi:hypothetical protein